jgi:lipopolysaccharide biosynthesis glycosyltransferase
VKRRKDHSQEPLTLLAGADDGYAMPLAVSLFSALDTLKPGREVNTYIVDGGFSTANRERVETVLGRPNVKLRLEWLYPDPTSVDTLPEPMKDHISVATYYRLLAPYLIADAKAIYLDSDLVVSRDLDELWQTNLKGHAVAASPNVGVPSKGHEIPHWQEQGLEPHLPYFNAGVLLLNLEKWREYNLTETVLENIRTYESSYEFADQDGLNAVLQTDWVELDKRWNAQISNDSFDLAGLDPREVGIIHYTGAFKPWQWLAFGQRSSYYAKFFRVLERSGWFSPLNYVRFRLGHALRSTSSIPKRVLSKLNKRTPPHWVRSKDT